MRVVHSLDEASGVDGLGMWKENIHVNLPFLYNCVFFNKYYLFFLSVNLLKRLIAYY